MGDKVKKNDDNRIGTIDDIDDQGDITVKEEKGKMILTPTKIEVAE